MRTASCGDLNVFHLKSAVGCRYNPQRPIETHQLTMASSCNSIPSGVRAFKIWYFDVETDISNDEDEDPNCYVPVWRIVPKQQVVLLSREEASAMSQGINHSPTQQYEYRFKDRMEGVYKASKIGRYYPDNDTAVRVYRMQEMICG